MKCILLVRKLHNHELLISTDIPKYVQKVYHSDDSDILLQYGQTPSQITKIGTNAHYRFI